MSSEKQQLELIAADHEFLCEEYNRQKALLARQESRIEQLENLLGNVVDQTGRLALAYSELSRRQDAGRSMLPAGTAARVLQ